MTSSESSVSCKDISLTCNDGIQLCGSRYTFSSSSTSKQHHHHRHHHHHEMKILCWHGWLDNCRSFYQLAPDLAEHFKEKIEVVALDFPGHGRSSHKSLDGPSMLLMEYCYYIHEAIHQLKWENEKVTLIGHSMGAAVSLMYSAAFPVQHLILLDSLGPHPKPATDVTRSLRQHIKARSRGKQPSSIYPGLAEAVETRCLTAKAFPGKQYISEEAAKELVEGATTELANGGLEFQFDQRLKWTSILFLSKDHVVQIYRDVGSSTTKTCLLLGRDGMPFDEISLTTARNAIKPDTMKTLPGSHHFHMDPDTAKGVSKEIIDFLSSS